MRIHLFINTSVFKWNQIPKTGYNNQNGACGAKTEPERDEFFPVSVVGNRVSFDIKPPPAAEWSQR